MGPGEDLVETYFKPYVRPLGNLAIIFAQCESLILELSHALEGIERKEARLNVSDNGFADHFKSVICISELAEHHKQELAGAFAAYWSMRSERHRLMHDPLYIGIGDDARAFVGTRGFARKKPFDLIFSEPLAAEIWDLAAAMKECLIVFDDMMYHLGKLPEAD